MSNAPNAHYFELAKARSLSQALRAGEDRSEAKVAKPPPVYTRFAAQSVKPPAGEQSAFAAGAVETWGAEVWDRLLDASMQLTASQAAFLMDGQGLVITTRGESHEPMDVLGARLSLTLDQAAMMSAANLPLQTVCIEVGELWLTGLRGLCSSAPELTIGLLSKNPVSGAQRSRVAALFPRIGAPPVEPERNE